MTQAELRLCSLLLQEHFGEIVEKVGNSLLRTGPRPLRLLVGDTGLLPDQVKKALCVLIQHNLVRYEVQPRGSVEYEAQSERILRILRYPRYIYTAKTLYGDPGELLVEELLLHGHLPMSCAVARVADRLTETMEEGKTMDYTEVSNTFVRLADTHFIQRCPTVPESPQSTKAPPPPAPALTIEEKDMYVVPRLSLVGKGKRRHSCSEEEEGQHKAKRQKQEGGTSEVLGMLEWWCLWYPDLGIGTWEEWDPCSQTCPGGGPLFLIFCGSFSSFFVALFPHFLWLFFLVFPALIPQFCVSFPLISCPISLWGILWGRKQTPGQIWGRGSPSSVPTVSAPSALPQEIPKTPDHAPSRTFYLYTVNVMAAARMLLHRCYKSVANLMERRQHEMQENKRLLDKSQRVEAILASMQATGAEAAQLHEVEEMITGPERQQLETLKRNVNKIDATENQVDETIFVLESFIESTTKRP
ncbi:RPC3 polymerase, partial [Sylvia borin]|nr:RPC3 polymerase [Sylvia borin]